MALPEPQKKEVPAYMVSFGDMITLLLTFFILLVALADTQTAGLVGAGRGSLIEHLLAQGSPGIMSGRLQERRLSQKQDLWWVPSQEGDPDQLERVREKLEREIPIRFKPDEATLDYHEDRLVLRLPARIEYDDSGAPVLNQAVRDVLAVVAEAVLHRPERHVRINGDVPRSGVIDVELSDSAQQARMIFENLAVRGVPGRQMSLWGWGASRPLAVSDPGRSINRGVTLEILDPPVERRPESQER